MAAKVPENIYRESLGSLTLTVGDFAGATTENSIDDDDTWTTNIPNPLFYWASGTNDPTTNTHGIDITLTTAATGVFTFRVGSANRNAQVFVLSKT